MNILFVHNKLQTFVKTDLDILRSAHAVQELNFRFKPRDFIEAVKGTIRADLIFCWFASFHCLVPVLIGKLLKKKVVIVGGGYDILYDPFISPGWLRDILRRAVGRILFPLMDKYVVNSEFSREKARERSYINPEKVERIYHGFQDFNGKPCRKGEVVLTVGGVEKTTKKRKGLETFAKASRVLSDIQFVIIGDWLDDTIEELRKVNSGNIRYVGHASSKELNDWYTRAQVYVQGSYLEGFGCALAEAMLARCIPVVTRRGAIPEVVGEAGTYIPYGDVDAMVVAMKNALYDHSDLGERARQRVLRRFPLEKRRKKLLRLIHEVVHPSTQTAEPLQICSGTSVAANVLQSRYIQTKES